jgi:peptidyl-prolyl cis-trans isomerase C
MPRRALVLVLLAGCAQQQRKPQDPNVVATVNGEAITRVDFEREFAREARAMEGVAARTPEQAEPYKQTLLSTMVQRLMLLQAAQDAGIAVTTEEVDRRVLALVSEYPAGAFDDALAQTEMTRAELTRRTRDQLTIEKLFEAQVFNRVAATEEQLRRYFEDHAEDFHEPERVHAQQIVVQGLDDAKRLQQLLSAGKKFPDLARRYSLSPEAKAGGDLGIFARGQMPSSFDEVLFKLAPGQVSEVVSTDYGYHLLRLVEKRPARRPELSEVRAQVEAKVLAELRADREKAYVAYIGSRAELRVNDQVLPTITAQPVPAHASEP